MCQYSKADFYERFLRDQLPVESYLPVNLISYVNYELIPFIEREKEKALKRPEGDREKVDIVSLLNWHLRHTHFYRRISINPNYYGIVVPDEQEQKTKAFTKYFGNLVNTVASELEKSEFIEVNEESTVTAGLLSKIALEYYINYETLDKFNRWLDTNFNGHTLRPLELIELISSHTTEFRRISIKNGELSFLKYLQRRHRPREGDQLHKSSFKIKLLILSQYQRTEGKEDEVEGELIEDRRFIILFSYRLLMAIVDIAWIKDSFHLAKTAIQLSRKLLPFQRETRPNIDMDVKITKEGDRIAIEVKAVREDRPFSYNEFETNYASLPAVMYRNEGWCFLVKGKPRAKDDEHEKLVLFKRIKTPDHGKNIYKLEDSELSENAESYEYELYLMSDFYPTSEDRRVADIDLHCCTVARDNVPIAT